MTTILSMKKACLLEGKNTFKIHDYEISLLPFRGSGKMENFVELDAPNLKLLSTNCPNVKFNFDVVDKIINLVEEHVHPKFHNATFVAGGIFTAYCEDNVFSKCYPKFYAKVAKEQDYNIYIQSSEPFEDILLPKLLRDAQITTDDMGYHKIRLANGINFTISPIEVPIYRLVDDFSPEPTRIYYDCGVKKIFIHQDFLTPKGAFFTNNGDPVMQLKYSMKGFVNRRLMHSLFPFFD